MKAGLSVWSLLYLVQYLTFSGESIDFCQMNEWIELNEGHMVSWNPNEVFLEQTGQLCQMLLMGQTM